jgi:hypothetical protein
MIKKKDGSGNLLPDSNRLIKIGIFVRAKKSWTNSRNCST